MKLPSGYEVNKETLVEICESIIGEKLTTECTYGEAFDSVGDALSVGEYADVPALDDNDIAFLYNTLKDVVMDCEARLRSTLSTFMAHSIVANSW